MVFEVLGPFIGYRFYPFVRLVTVFLVWSFDRVAKLYYLIMKCENARLIGCHFPGLGLKKGISFRLRMCFPVIPMQ